MNERKTLYFIPSCGCDSILPFLLVYIFYIILHGHLSPGGGFQGGVLAVAIVILMYLGHGYETTENALSKEFMHKGEGVISIGYIALALIGVFAGANFCENVLYDIGNIGDLYSSGTIFWMNLAVGLKVFAGVTVLALSMFELLNVAEKGVK